MTPLSIIFKFNNLEEAKPFAATVNQKFTFLEKFIPDGKEVICEVEFEKVSSQSHGRIFRVEVNVEIDGSLHRAEATEDSFEAAIDEVKNELDKVLRRAKDKQVTLEKDSGRAFKDQLLNDVESED
jgi:ribosomal subunit interface protein